MDEQEDSMRSLLARLQNRKSAQTQRREAPKHNYNMPFTNPTIYGVPASPVRPTARTPAEMLKNHTHARSQDGHTFQLTYTMAYTMLQDRRGSGVYSWPEDGSDNWLKRYNFDADMGKEFFKAVEERAAFLSKHKEDEVEEYVEFCIANYKRAVGFARAARRYYQKGGNARIGG